MRKVVSETSLRYHVEGTDYPDPEEDNWYFISASDYLDLPASTRTETAEKIAKKWRTNYRRVRIVDTQAEED